VVRVIPQWASGGSASPGIRAMVSGAVGVGAGAAAAVLGLWWLGPLVAWDAAAALLLLWTWRLVWRLSPSETASYATRESPGRANTDLLLLCVSVISLVAVGLVLVRASHETGLDKGLLVGVSVVSIVMAWSTVNTVYALRYASLYHHDGDRGDVDFNDSAAPSYPDFAYLALTIGMTFQVSDTDLESERVPPPRTAPRAALLHVRRTHHCRHDQPHRWTGPLTGLWAFVRRGRRPLRARRLRRT
jgi:uncharacterized membrane protein